MSLLRQIQESILEPGSEIGPILLKLRFLASRLGSTQLEDWVKHEAEGYPPESEVPEYRKLSVTYHGTWSGPFGSSVNNAPIPPYLIEKFASKLWTTIDMRQSIATVDELASGEGDELQIDASNLMLSLQGKVYPNYSCVSVEGKVHKTAMREIQNTVRNRVLELTIELEKVVPTAVNVELGEPVGTETGSANTVTQVFYQTIHGPNTTVTSSGARAQIDLTIAQGDANALIDKLVKTGIPEEAAKEFADTLASEEPEGSERPFGKRARKWFAQNIEKATDGTWKIGVGIATKVLEEAAMRYYGLK